jgi:hypothetical protein
LEYDWRVCTWGCRLGGYGRGTIDVVDNQLKAHAGVAQALTLAGTSLLAMINAPLGAAPTFKKPFEMEPPASVQTASNKQPVKDRRIALAIDEKRRRVLFDFGLELKGNDFVLFDRLAECFRSDKANGRPAEQYSFTATKKLLGYLLIEEHTLLQRVRRIRKQLEKHFLTASDYMLDEQDIIQSRRWKGYRLNPYLLLVEPADMRDQ